MVFDCLRRNPLSSISTMRGSETALVPQQTPSQEPLPTVPRRVHCSFIRGPRNGLAMQARSGGGHADKRQRSAGAPSAVAQFDLVPPVSRELHPLFRVVWSRTCLGENPGVFSWADPHTVPRIYVYSARHWAACFALKAGGTVGVKQGTGKPRSVAEPWDEAFRVGVCKSS